jgi:fluoride exporter
VTHDPDQPADLPVDPDLTDGTDVFGRAAGRVGRHRRWDIALVIGAGGAVGGGARWGLTQAWPPAQGGFPWATFVENVTGCLVLGALMVFLLDVWRPSRYARPFLGIGVLGGFTTFSTYTADARALILDGQGLLALAYLFGTLFVALAASWTGLVLARTAAGITPRAR